MAKRPKPVLPATRRALRDMTGAPPRAFRSTPLHSPPGRKGSGKSPLAGEFNPPPDKSDEVPKRKRRR